MKILLTGSNGFLGKYIYDYLSKYNSVYTLSRTNSNYCTDLSLSIPDFSEKFDLVIHAAGKAHLVPQNKKDIDSFININTNGTFNLIQGLNNVGYPKYFVFISSVSVYGIDEGTLINETFPLNAKDPYGKSKIEAEEIVKKWCQENNVICTILRLPLVVGENPPGNLGAMIRGIKKGYYFNIAGGNAKKSMVLATDVAKFILKAAEMGGTYNLTDGQHPTFNELSKNIACMMGKSFIPNLPKLFAYLLAKLDDYLGNKLPLNSDKFLKITSTLTFDDNKARIAFGWNPSPVLDYFKIQQDAK
jgi:nucleoside-diphosphate-sugar epimerase